MLVYCDIAHHSLLQIWRLITGLLWYPVNFRWLMMLYFLYSYSQRLETGWPHDVADVAWCTGFNCSYVYVGYFSGMPADYVFMLVFNAICIDVSLQQLKYGKMVQLKLANISTSVVIREGSVKQHQLLFSNFE